MARLVKSAYDVLNDQLSGRSRCSVTLRTSGGVALVESSHEVSFRDERDSSATSEVVLDVHADLGGVSDVTLSLDSSTTNGGPHTDNSSVDSAGDAVLLLDVDLGEVEVFLIVSVVLLDVSARGSVDHVSHLESLDGLVLGNDSSTVDTSDDVGVALVVLTATVVSSLRWHF